METTPSSSLTRYRPVVLAITGFAAAYAAFLLYKQVQSEQPVPSSSSGIRRSNAITRRNRPERVHERRNASDTSALRDQRREAEAALEELDFGAIDSYGQTAIPGPNDETIEIELRTRSLPTSETLREQHGLSEAQATEALAMIHREFVGRFMIMQLHNRSESQSFQTEVFAAARFLEGLGISQDEIRAGIEQMMQHVSAENNQREGNDGDTIAGTEVDVEFSGRRDGRVGLNLKQLLYHIAESQARQTGFLHRGFRCDSCGASPIRGTRWKCANCVDLDLCDECHATCMHNRNHIFYEIRIPSYAMNNLHVVQEVAYPGRIDLSKSRALPAELCKSLVENSDLEKAEVEALYEQFVCIADEPSEKEGIGYAISRENFPHIISPLSSYSPLQSNLVFDRLFNLFDADKDSVISFEEFVKGAHFLRKRGDDKDRWKKCFEAYDVDGDGIITRKDCLRMFRALWQIQKDLTIDFTSKNEAINGLRDATVFAAGGRVISSAFTQSPRTVPENRPPQQKTKNAFGDRRSSTRTQDSMVRPNKPSEGPPDEIWANAWESQAQFPFDHDTGQAFSLKDFVYVAPRGGGKPRSLSFIPHVARDQRVRFNFDGASIPEAREEAIEERRKRQHFYEYDAPRSLKVGDYEVPGRKQDIGKDIAFQVMEDAMNELLDPIFKAKEDLAMQTEAAKQELRLWKEDIDAFMKRKEELHKIRKSEEADPLMAVAAAAEEAARIEKEEADRQRPERRLNGHAVRPTVVERRTLEEAVADVEQHVQSQELGELLDSQGFGVRSSAPSPDEVFDLPSNTANIEDFIIDGPALERQNRPRSQRRPMHLRNHPEQLENVFVMPEPSNSRFPISRLTHPPSSEAIPAPPHVRLQEEGADQTWPQNRPNSDAEVIEIRVNVPIESIDAMADPMRRPEMVVHEVPWGKINRPHWEAEVREQFETLFMGWERDPETGIVSNSATRERAAAANGTSVNNSSGKPDEVRLERLAQLQAFSEELKKRAGIVGLDFPEFQAFINGTKGTDFKFLEGWLETAGVNGTSRVIVAKGTYK